MQATIEISEEQAQTLMQYCQITHISQNEAFQQALKLFLPTLPSKKKLSDHPAFGGSDQKQEMILNVLCLFSVNYKFSQHLLLITTAFGSWKNKNIESLDYQITLREE